MIRALDVSFNAPKVTPEWCRARLGEGYRLLIADLWTGKERIEGAESALRNWREAGGTPAADFVGHDGRTAEQHFNEARESAGAGGAKLSLGAGGVESEA